MGVVLQNDRLIAGDIFSNIAGGRPLTPEEAWEAAEKVGIAAEIRRMPLGLLTPVGEGGGNLSGGQRQRILIPRSIVRHPRIIIMSAGSIVEEGSFAELMAKKGVFAELASRQLE